MGKWDRFQEEVLKEKADSRLILYWHRLIYCWVEQNDGRGNSNSLARFKYLGNYNLKIKELTKEGLSRYPLIFAAVKSLESGHKADAIEHIPQRDWYRMVNKYLAPMEDAQIFKYNGNYYGPQFSWDTTYMKGEVKQLASILKTIGASAILAGLLLARRLYISKQGIMINSQRTAILWDVIVVIFATFAAYMVVSTALLKAFFIAPFLTMTSASLWVIFSFL